jgi:hypothetical protein
MTAALKSGRRPLHGWQDDNWDEQMKRDIAEGKLDAVLREVDEDIQAGRLKNNAWSVIPG